MIFDGLQVKFQGNGLCFLGDCGCRQEVGKIGEQNATVGSR